MHRIVLTFSLLLILFSCQEKEQKTIALEDIIQTSTTSQESTTPTKDFIVQFQPTIDLKLAQELSIQWDSIIISEELTVPERFSPKNTEKFTYWKDEKSVEYARWSFSDSSKSMKAFLNWMNCYGERCAMIDIRAPKNIQRDGLLILQNDTCVIQIQSSRMSQNELNKWKEFYLNDKKTKWNYLISQAKNGKSNWSHFSKGKEINYEPLNIE